LALAKINGREKEIYPILEILQKLVSTFSAKFNFKKTEDVFDEISKSINLCSEINYKLLIKKNGITLNNTKNNEEEPQVVYHSNRMLS
jgi:predicted molibdopterin-dependent oxidoreductase YjgC